MTGHQPAPMAAKNPEIADRLTVRIPVGDAARRHHHTERCDERRNFRVGDQRAVDEADHEAADETRGDREERIESGQARIDRMREAFGLGKARRDHRRHADERAGREVDAARDDHLGDADGDDADLRLLQDHDLQAQRIDDEALPDEDPPQDLEQEHHADHDAENAEFGRQAAATGGTSFARRCGGGNVGGHGSAPVASFAPLLRRELHDLDLVCILAIDDSRHAPLVHDEIRSLMPSTSGISDEIIMTATPWPASSLMSLWISALAPTSMPRVGSSRMRMRGFVISQRAISTFC